MYLQMNPASSRSAFFVAFTSAISPECPSYVQMMQTSDRFAVTAPPPSFLMPIARGSFLSLLEVPPQALLNTRLALSPRTKPCRTWLWTLSCRFTLRVVFSPRKRGDRFTT